VGTQIWNIPISVNINFEIFKASLSELKISFKTLKFAVSTTSFNNRSF
jgi:hypothetical protein